MKQTLKPNTNFLMTLSQVASKLNMCKKTTLQTLRSIEAKTGIAILFKTGGKTSPWVISTQALAKANLNLLQHASSN